MALGVGPPGARAPLPGGVGAVLSIALRQNKEGNIQAKSKYLIFSVRKLAATVPVWGIMSGWRVDEAPRERRAGMRKKKEQ